MIISRKHGYIFLHSRKTAGSSISVSLSRDLGPDDLMLSGLLETMEAGMPIPAHMIRDARAQLRDQPLLQETRMRAAFFGLRGKAKRHYAIRKLVNRRYSEMLNEEHPQHAYAETIARAFPEDWAAFPKICVVRNPWTKMVSDYFWRTRRMPQRPTFEAFVRAIETGDDLGGYIQLRYSDNWPLYTIDNEIVADHVIRFENLMPGLAETFAALNIPFDGWLPNAKGGHRPNKGKKADPRSFYTPELRDTVGRLYEREIAAFDYRF